MHVAQGKVIGGGSSIIWQAMQRGIPEDFDALDLYIRQAMRTARHVSCTYKMGADCDSMAVVDQYCSVKGVQGLSVVDASVMPSVPRSGGCYATVLMIGERAVEWISSA